MIKEKRRKAAYRFIDKILRHRAEIQTAVDEAKNTNNRDTVCKSGNSISDPTANQAIKSITPVKSVTLSNGLRIRNPEKWLDAISRLFDVLYPEETEILSKIYSGFSIIKISRECHIDFSSVYRLRKECRHILAEIACQYGLIQVVEE